jgi:hypothetical protein
MPTENEIKIAEMHEHECSKERGVRVSFKIDKYIVQIRNRSIIRLQWLMKIITEPFKCGEIWVSNISCLYDDVQVMIKRMKMILILLS